MLTHNHTGKLRAHHHTSYASLVLLLILAIVLVVGMSWTAMAATPAVNPQSGSVGLTGVVTGAAPSTAATILSPSNAFRTTTIPVTVTGTCPASTFVTVNKNDAFGGVAACQDDGTYSMLVDLFAGANTLVARVSDALGQYGPDSASITAYYDAPSLNTPGGNTGKQLFLNLTTTVVAGNPGDQISRSVTIVGGVAPYAINWEWGDDATSLMSATGEGSVTASHAYARAGTYRVIVHVTDKNGTAAFVQFVTVVNGQAAAVGTTQGTGLGALPGKLVAAWPLLSFMLVLVVAFWLGERREQAKISRRTYV